MNPAVKGAVAMTYAQGCGFDQKLADVKAAGESTDVFTLDADPDANLIINPSLTATLAVMSAHDPASCGAWVVLLLHYSMVTASCSARHVVLADGESCF